MNTGDPGDIQLNKLQHQAELDAREQIELELLNKLKDEEINKLKSKFHLN